MCKYLHLIFFVLLVNFSFAQTKNHSTLIDEAIQKAKIENKQVFINYLAEGCEMSEKMKDQLSLNSFKANYVVVNIEVSKDEALEYVNCSNPVKSFSSGHCEAIEFPFWYVLDTTGNFTATSFKENNYNIGYPNTKSDINDFIQVLRNTSKISEAKLNVISDRFISNSNLASN